MTKGITNLLEKLIRGLSQLLFRISKVPKNPTELRTSEAKMAIVITTHSRRFWAGCLPLIRAFRHGESPVTNPIYVVINADTFGTFDQGVRSTFLRELTNYASVFPICLGSPAGMSELWNTGIRLSGADKTLVLSDDLSIVPGYLENFVRRVEELLDTEPMLVLNHSWGHFAICTETIRKVGWFDERLLGFGEEDGEFSSRYHEVYGCPPSKYEISGLHNFSSKLGFEENVKKKGKYSLFNHVFINLKYPETRDHKPFGFMGNYSTSVGNLDPYPAWAFKDKFKHLLEETEESQIRYELETYFNQSAPSDE